MNKSKYMKSGINQIGGNFRTRKQIDEYTPYHEYFLSLFLGSGIYELNKPKAHHYECWNDANPRFANYFIVIKEFREKFEARRKEGPCVINCRYLYDLLNKGILTPNDMIDEAIHFHYQIKLTHGSQLKYRGLVPETTSKKDIIKTAKKTYQEKLENQESIECEGRFKSNLGKTTRPISNNDCGILTKINPNAQERLEYVIIECLDFRKCYEQFYKAYHVRKGLTKEVYVFADPPFPGTEGYYSGLFHPEDHHDLIKLALETPFHFNLQIGGECQFYLDTFKKAKWNIVPIENKHSLNAKVQSSRREYLIMNYDINKLPLMKYDSEQNTLEKFFDKKEWRLSHEPDNVI